jgi:hypothetical protein
MTSNVELAKADLLISSIVQRIRQCLASSSTHSAKNMFTCRILFEVRVGGSSSPAKSLKSVGSCTPENLGSSPVEIKYPCDAVRYLFPSSATIATLAV